MSVSMFRPPEQDSITYCAIGSPTTCLSDSQVRDALNGMFAALGQRSRVLAVPPDGTRPHSRAGLITKIVADQYGPALTDILPALGTHVPMTSEQIARYYPGVPPERFRVHDWRNDIVTVGELDAEFVRQASEGIAQRPWPAQLNRLIWVRRQSRD
jgi:nickel-dependent lactate racemase